MNLTKFSELGSLILLSTIASCALVLIREDRYTSNKYTQYNHIEEVQHQELITDRAIYISQQNGVMLEEAFTLSEMLTILDDADEIYKIHVEYSSDLTNDLTYEPICIIDDYIYYKKLKENK